MPASILITCFSFLFSASVFAGAHSGDAGDSARDREFVEMSGFEGREDELGAAVAKTIKEITPPNSARHDFTDAVRQKRLGHAVSTAIRTINVDTPYMHEMNDALVKMTLTYIQFAKDHDLLDDMIETEVKTQFPMLSRVRRLIEKTGDKQLAIQAITDRTACFYQLVEDAERGPGYIRYASPFGNVLTVTRKLGQHDLTEEEIHRIWTIPRVKAQADVLGVDINVSDWNEDGVITISLPESAAGESVAATVGGY